MEGKAQGRLPYRETPLRLYNGQVVLNKQVIMNNGIVGPAGNINIQEI